MMRNIFLLVILLAVVLIIAMIMRNRESKMYSLAFRKKSDPNDFFWLDKDYTFYQYQVDTERYWLADPFLFESDGKTYVFYEAYDLWTGKGALGFSIVDHENRKLTPPEIVLERKYHFSWPYIFEHDGEIYIMPETCGDYRVRLFRAVNFPHEWTEDEIIHNDIFACDSIFLQDGEKNYLLASDQYHNTPTGTYPSCFVKNTLFTFKPGGKFQLEPDGKIDPAGKIVASGDYGIRNAGKIFTAQGMKIRPGQDCTNRQYGRGVVFFRIYSVEPYREEELFRIDCENIGSHLKQNYTAKIIGLHTYNQSQNYEVIDFAGFRSVPISARIMWKVNCVIKRLRRIF